MKQIIEIRDNAGKVLFHGHFLDIPIKDEAIKNKSIELFDDDDPCIIHKSFVVKKFVEEMLELFNGNKVIYLNDYKEQLPFLALNIEDCTLMIGEKR